MCGEQFLLLLPADAVLGSPPRVRGTDELAENIQGGYRITPACAGNRHLYRHLRQWSKDHPRVCGEQHCTA